MMTGSLAGVSFLYDLNVVKATDNSGITVTAEGTGISAVTGSDGRWVLSQLPMGTYTISASKPAYGTAKQFGYQFVGGGQTWYGELSIGELPAFRVTGLSTTNTTTAVNLRGTCTNDTRSYPRNLRVFCGYSATVSSDPVTYASTFRFGMGNTQFETFTVALSKSDLNLQGFPSGRTAYAVVYTEGNFSTVYTDMSTNRYWYGSLNPTPSNVVSFIVP